MLLNLFLVALLIILTAFFVATEFAIIKLRPSRVDQMVMEGRKNALAVKRVTTNLDGYLSACQLGITITALGLGALGEPTVEKMLSPVFASLNLPASASHILSYGIAFVAMTYLHVVLGELAPKTMAIRMAEQIAVICAPLIILFYKIMYPFIWVLNGSANMLVRLFGMKPASEHEEAHSEEEIRIILSESYESGKINNAEYGYVNRIFNFDELLAREIMVPRTDMTCLYADQPLEDNLAIIRKEQYTRFPVARESKDQIIGFINTKQFYLQYDYKPDFQMDALIQPVLTVPETMPIKTLLRKMQLERSHIALLLDEYGGTSGMVTIEDIIEEIVGEIRDEFDGDEKAGVEKIGPDRYLLEGMTSVDEVNRLLGTHFDQDGVDSIGGFLYSRESELTEGSSWQEEEWTFTILKADRNRIVQLELAKRDVPIEAGEAGMEAVEERAFAEYR